MIMEYTINDLYREEYLIDNYHLHFRDDSSFLRINLWRWSREMIREFKQWKFRILLILANSMACFFVRIVPKRIGNQITNIYLRISTFRFHCQTLYSFIRRPCSACERTAMQWPFLQGSVNLLINHSFFDKTKKGLGHKTRCIGGCHRPMLYTKTRHL